MMSEPRFYGSSDGTLPELLDRFFACRLAMSANGENLVHLLLAEIALLKAETQTAWEAGRDAAADIVSAAILATQEFSQRFSILTQAEESIRAIKPTQDGEK
jgi:uncharacterized small protein (DUF1192 family)